MNQKTNEAGELPQWTTADSAAADKEGWGLFNFDESRGLGEIQRDDEANRFATDDDAIDFVRQQATNGDVVAAKALKLHGAPVPNILNPRKSPEKRIMATFIPEADIGSNVVEINGRREVDVTAQVLALSAIDIRNLGDRDYPTDELVDPRALGHTGPYTVEVEQSVRAFFGVGSLSSDVTDEMVARARVEHGIASDGKLADAGAQLSAQRLILATCKTSTHCFITDNNGRKLAEMYEPGAEEIGGRLARRIVGSVNALPSLVGVLLRADKEGALWQALYNEGITDAYDAAMSDAVKALGDDGVATVAHLYELNVEEIQAKIDVA